MPASHADAVSQNKYFTFTLTPVSGQQMTLSNLTFFGNVGANTAIAQSFTLDVSTDGTNFVAAGTGTFTVDSATDFFSIDLSSYINVITQTTFRMSFHDSVNGGTV